MTWPSSGLPARRAPRGAPARAPRRCAPGAAAALAGPGAASGPAPAHRRCISRRDLLARASRHVARGALQPLAGLREGQRARAAHLLIQPGHGLGQREPVRQQLPGELGQAGLQPARGGLLGASQPRSAGRTAPRAATPAHSARPSSRRLATRSSAAARQQRVQLLRGHPDRQRLRARRLGRGLGATAGADASAAERGEAGRRGSRALGHGRPCAAAPAGAAAPPAGSPPGSCFRASRCRASSSASADGEAQLEDVRG